MYAKLTDGTSVIYLVEIDGQVVRAGREPNGELKATFFVVGSKNGLNVAVDYYVNDGGYFLLYADDEAKEVINDYEKRIAAGIILDKAMDIVLQHEDAEANPF